MLKTLKYVGIGALVVVSYMTITDQIKESDAQVAKENAVHEQAVDIRNAQVDRANNIAGLLIQKAEGEQKACLELAGMAGKQDYEKVQLCNIRQFDIQSLNEIKG